ncbi:MBL fold metallo-hydrolase [Paenibacillus sp. CGMCC 1.16610]|uniref:MBL fold metallo-hydrolase n=1 Tax=Paenibacillus anseongense TaxID=2682845 RepID=A0ABW9U5M1_9BACL|nr:MULTISPECIES: MBL fold metallo-hydrolase [Paenibacillus]MBA2942580.1 MBL fold metallo-hydrolase [Paenibacillus sp. CGMCC 1.16610]MVQ35394.1 MBL fold metallo-hydrolase [Paenibacillus anseongense]
MVQLGSGITTIQLSVANNSNSFIPTILWDDQDVILFDTGIPGQLELIRAAFQELSIPFEKLTKIIITHQDMDHIGSLPALVEAFGDQVQVLAHETAVPYLAGEIPLVKSKKLAPPVKVDVALKDGDILPFVGGIRVVYTPGHTPDHTSYYHIPSKTLIAGDALTAKDGVLQSYNPTYTPDQETALASIAKLQELDLNAIIAFHGGVCTDNLQARLQEIVTAGPVVNN